MRKTAIYTHQFIAYGISFLVFAMVISAASPLLPDQMEYTDNSLPPTHSLKMKVRANLKDLLKSSTH